jgi:hypothetical protein
MCSLGSWTLRAFSTPVCGHEAESAQDDTPATVSEYRPVRKVRLSKTWSLVRVAVE